MADWTVKEYADRERVHERTVRRWVERGTVPSRRLPGGPHRQGQIRIINPGQRANSDISGQMRTSADTTPPTILRRP